MDMATLINPQILVRMYHACACLPGWNAQSSVCWQDAQYPAPKAESSLERLTPPKAS
ncbi:hypothetical protein [Oleiagrimonas sp. C23AA]|uniref:hypothetical protein n=1 Tax=Oleiagrimonas sp. C23AA TaxID=2719047 RepID=UPI00141DF748|nr:hypothetical protein [Oleiagrimonas sp. C23AA]NII10450.1 hypothetical protein [Oleiagrimonas sp. C23AA]